MTETNIPDFDWPELSGGSYTADDEEVNRRVAEAAEEHGVDPEEVYENVSFILDASGDGSVTAEGVAVSAGENPDTESDSRLEALNIWEMRQGL